MSRVQISGVSFAQLMLTARQMTMLEKFLREKEIYATSRLYTLTYIDDEAKRRGTLTQFNCRVERHSVAGAALYGKRGELRQHNRIGQEDQLGAVGLVLNMIVL